MTSRFSVSSLLGMSDVFSARRTRTKQRAFTLVELSIVLVIIGLIVASILVGQDLIRQAELRSTISQYDQFNQAVNTFRTKYGQLPGDIDNASTFFTSATNGNGNNVIGGSAIGGATASMTTETMYFWNHLDGSNAALIPGTYSPASGTLGTGFPKSKIGQGWGVYTTGSAVAPFNVNFFILGAATSMAVYSSSAVLTPLDARSIDLKVDDGLPLIGGVQARVTGTGNPEEIAVNGVGGYIASAGGTACILGAGAYAAGSSASYTYNAQGTAVACNLRFRMQH